MKKKYLLILAGATFLAGLFLIIFFGMRVHEAAKDFNEYYFPEEHLTDN